MKYQIQIPETIFKALKKVPSKTATQIRQKIDSLQENPRPSGVKKLTSKHDLYRCRVGDYRIIYNIQDKNLLILIIKLGHRKDVYDG